MRSAGQPTSRWARRTVAWVVSVVLVIATGFATLGTSGWAEIGPPAVSDLTYKQVVKRGIDSIAAYWGEEFPRVFGMPYRELGDAVAFDSDLEIGGDVSVCTSGARYEEMPPAFYCPIDDVIGYDDEGFMPSLYDEFGPFAVGMVFAHEWGHAIQSRVLTDAEAETASTVLLETQADCYSGAWTGYLVSGEGEDLSLEAGDLEVGVAGLLEVRDPVGFVDPSAEGAHGNAFDRVSAFQSGFDGGAERCARWFTEPPTITESAFTDIYDLATGGDASYREALRTTEQTLSTFWSATRPSFDPPEEFVEYEATDKKSLEPCSSLELDSRRPAGYEGHVYYCSDDNTVYADENLTRDAHEMIGDFALAVLVANAWSTAVQDDLGLEDGPAATSLRASCLSGAWAGTLPVKLTDGTVVAARGGPVAFDYGDVVLSPGDLDEVVEAYLLLGDPSRVTQGESRRQRRTPATTFERVAAFRAGFFAEDPLAACGGPEE